MIKDVLNVNNKWRVIIYFNIDYNSLSYLSIELKKYNVVNNYIKNIILRFKNKHIKAVTISNIEEKYSIVCFRRHKSEVDMLNSIIHESEHIKDSIVKYYNVENDDESNAYTIGFVSSQIIKKYLTYS